MNFKFFDKQIKQHQCRICKAVVIESGYLRSSNMKEIRAVNVWKKDIKIKTLTHPLDRSRLIAIDVACACSNCGSDNLFIIATALDDKSKIRVMYNKLFQRHGKLYA